MSKKPLTAIIVGAGHRAITYASYAEHHPDQLRIVGVADPLELRRQQTRARFGFGADRCFASAAELARRPKLADFVINGTMDQQHVPTSLPLLAAGYHMLLEKPFATNEKEMWNLVLAARKHRRKVAICHVLRYAPFYRAIRQELLDGVIGDVLNVQATEHVSYHHVSVAFVRGKWNRDDVCMSTMLMAKCCHDLDLITWMKSGVPPVQVASFGSNYQFRPERTPRGAGRRCLVDCRIEKDCLYSARKLHLNHPNRWSFYAWDSLEHLGKPTLADMKLSLQRANPHGRCAWKCDNNVVDHQSVAIEFADGCTATLNMIGGCAKASRSIHLIGTRGEIQGNFEDSRFVIRHIETRPRRPEFVEKVVDLSQRGDMTGAHGGHGGGDLRLVGDFVAVLRGSEPSISSTSLDDSVNGHLLGFCADLSREKHVVVDVRKRQR
jgi:predicted dehydrogenase